ncbi:MAG: short-chain dehydrogenase/reductase SDR, partial [Planctomycetota bacterium]
MGIGRAIAIELAQQGANVAINFRSHREQAEEVAREIEKTGQKALLLQADVSEQAAVEEMVTKTASTFG